MYLQIAVTAQYLPGIKNTKADQASMEVQKSLNEWFYTKGYFRRSWNCWEQVDIQISLLRGCATKVCKLTPKFSCMDGQCFSEELEESATIHLPSLCLNRPGGSQSHSSVEQSQVWYTQLLKLVVADPVLIPPFASLLVNPDGYQHLLCQNLTLNLATWKYQTRYFWTRLIRPSCCLAWK